MFKFVSLRYDQCFFFFFWAEWDDYYETDDESEEREREDEYLFLCFLLRLLTFLHF